MRCCVSFALSKWPSNEIALAFANDEDRARRVADYLFRGAAKDAAGDTFASVSRDDYQINTKFAGSGGDFEVWQAGTD